jgi:hypothetical protein
MDEASPVRDRAVRANKDVLGDGPTEDFDFEDACDYLLRRLAVDVGVHEHGMVVARDNVAECGETFFDTLKGDSVWESIAEMLQLLVRRRRRHEEPMSVASGETADDARATDRGVHDGDDLAELRLERGVEVGAALDGDEAVRVCEFGENADIAAVFELETCR